jgi:hypothetical protein
MNRLNLRLTPAALRAIAEILTSGKSGMDVPAILRGRQNSSHEDQWSIGIYSRMGAMELERLYATKGHVALYEIDGSVFCIPQPDLVPLLEGKTLDIIAGAVKVS